MVEVYELWTVIVSLIVLKLCHWIYQWNNPKCKGKLPPGSMGFPIVGETFEYIKPHDATQFSPWLMKRTLRHGPLFRTSLYGNKVIVSTDDDLNMEMAKTNKIPGVTSSVTRLFGENNMFLQSKDSHNHVRNLSFQLLGSQGLKLRIIEDFDLLARKYMKEGARNGYLDVKETTSKILIECLSKKVMGEMEPEAAKELALCWRFFPSGWVRFSVNLPGIGVYRIMKARKRMMEILKETVLKKRASGEEFGEFFKIILGENEGGKESIMNVEKAIEYIFTLFLISNETTPGTVVATIKLISENPKVKQELQREHDAIFGSRSENAAAITWEDYKSMTFTHMVINETLRMTTTIPTVHRIPDHDIQVGDYTIPAGWTFMGFPSIHFSPEKYDDPLVFNPWRWKGKDMGSTISKNFAPFGAGPRLCIGADLAKFVMAIFIHHLCRYRWSMKAETTMVRTFILQFPHGCDVQIFEDDKVEDNSLAGC